MKVYHREQTDAERAASKQGRRARMKGITFERELVVKFNAELEDYHAERGLQSKGGRGKADVRLTGSVLEFHCETKNMAKPNPRKAYAQAKRDAKFSSTPIAITKASGEHMVSALVTMSLDDFIGLLRSIEKPELAGTVKIKLPPGIGYHVETEDA